MKRLRPGPKVHQLPPPVRITLTDEEAQTIARRRAQVDLPTRDRDFIEVWGASGERQPKRKRKRPA